MLNLDKYVPYPNVHIVKMITSAMTTSLTKSTWREKLAFSCRTSDMIFNRMRENKPKQKRPLHSQSFPDTSLANPAQESCQHHHDASLSSGPITWPRFQAYPSGLPSQTTVNMYRHGHGDQPSYAAVVSKSTSLTTAQTGFQPSATIDLNTVLGLLKVYESMHSQ